MKIRLRQSGGIMGLVRGCEVDTSRCDPSQAQAIESAAAACRASPGLSKGGADLTTYDIQLTVDSKHVRLEVDDGTMTPELYQLIEQLAPLTKPIPLH